MGGEKKYPECEKLADTKQYSQKIGEFLEWLEEKGVELATRHTHTKECVDPRDQEVFEEDPDELDDDEYLCGCHEDELLLYYVGTEKLLADFFGIDLKKVEEERRAMIEDLRNG